MAYGGRPSVTKRQKEIARAEKRKEKADRRARRKAERDESPQGESTLDSAIADIVPGPQPPSQEEDS